MQLFINLLVKTFFPEDSKLSRVAYKFAYKFAYMNISGESNMHVVSYKPVYKNIYFLKVKFEWSCLKTSL